MTTKDGRDQITRFQDAVAELIDLFLKEKLDPDSIQQVLDDEADSVHTRQKELEDKQE